MSAEKVTYRIVSRIAGQTQWTEEGSATEYDSFAKAESAIKNLEAVNDDGDELEYLIVEHWSKGGGK